MDHATVVVVTQHAAERCAERLGLMTTDAIADAVRLCHRIVVRRDSIYRYFGRKRRGAKDAYSGSDLVIVGDGSRNRIFLVNLTPERCMVVSAARYSHAKKGGKPK